MIELEAVAKHYGGKVAVSPTSLSIEPRRCLALLGTSGCGKSTLLRMIMGLIVPDGGRVLIGGDEMNAANAIRLRRKMGYVIQDGGLFPHMTASENVTLLARHLGWAPDKIASRLRALAALVRLDDAKIDLYPAELSGGQRQRVGLMRALMLDPDVLLLDEPLGALDPIVRSQLQSDLRGIFSELDKTVVLVTHDLGEAGFLADQVVLMSAGSIVQKGTIKDLVDHPATPFVKEFLSAQRPPSFEGKPS